MIIYAICLAVGLVFTLFSAITSHFFGGHDVGGHGGDVGTGGHADAGYDHSGLPGISFFSPTVLASYVTAFGACGLILERIPATKSIWISAPISAVAGMLIASLTFFIFNAMFKSFQGSSESRVGTLIGQVASVATPIPANGVGEISYVQGGSRYTAPARTTDGSAVTAGKCVRISRIVGTQFFVEIESEPLKT
jgi:membrane protein implicated in regulation of membrane protease activity